MSDFSFSKRPIDIAATRRRLEDPACGGYAAFEGWVRNHNEGMDVVRLEYEAFEALAVKEGKRIMDEAIQRFGVSKAACVHRVGELQIGDLAVWVGVSAPHRDEAFAACRYIIDEVKTRVPIWKKEHYASGDSGWVNCERCAAHGDHEHATAALPAPDYSRQMVLKEIGEAGQRKLAESSVLVIGAGGLGSPVLSYLAAAGIGKLGIVDGDCLEASNLHRQVIFELEDIGRPKVILAKERLAALNPSVEIETWNKRLSAREIEGVMARFDLVIDCTDNLAAKFLINDAAVLTNTPAVFASVYQYEGQVQVFEAKTASPCLRCVWPQAMSETSIASCAEAGVLGPVPGVFGSVQAMEAMRLLLSLPGGLGDDLLIFDLNTYRTRRIRSRRCAECTEAGECVRIRDLQQLHPGFDADLEVAFSNLADAEAAGYALVDIREPAEIEQAPLPCGNVLRIPMQRLEQNHRALETNSKYLIICARGARSKGMAQRLRKDGLLRVFSLRGGVHSLESAQTSHVPDAPGNIR